MEELPMTADKVLGRTLEAPVPCLSGPDASRLPAGTADNSALERRGAVDVVVVKAKRATRIAGAGDM